MYLKIFFLDCCLYPLRVEGINNSLEKRSLDTITEKIYKKVFSFPVKDYYERLGFDFKKEPFEVAGDEFVEYYGKFFHKVKLHDQVDSVLESISNAGLSQSILSAGKQEYLYEWVEFHGLSDYFVMIRGIDNQYATGKIELGLSFINELSYAKDNVVMVGDTVHDSDVADAMGIDCILINHGHMGAKKLKATGCKVFSNLIQVRNYLL